MDWYIGTHDPPARKARVPRACLPCMSCPAPHVRAVRRRPMAQRHGCGTAWRACAHEAAPDLRARDEAVLVLVDADEDRYEVMQLALEVRLGARHVHARVVQRRREGRHLGEVTVGQVVAVLLEAAGGGACRLRHVDGHYAFAEQHLWLAIVPLPSAVSRGPAFPGAGHRAVVDNSEQTRTGLEFVRI